MIVDSSLHTQVLSQIQFCLDKFQEEYGLSIDFPEVTYNPDLGQPRWAGCAHYDAHKIWFNPWFLNSYKETFIKRTVIHEVAHILVRKLQEAGRLSWRINPHGLIFKKLMVLLGADKKNTSEKHSYDVRVLPHFQHHHMIKCVECDKKFLLNPSQKKKFFDGFIYNCSCDGTRFVEVTEKDFL